MKKRLKDQLCVYCFKRPAVTDDHIFARGFFLESDRGNVPKAPACEPCNNEKSKLELYLTAVLPFGGRHGDALQNLASLVPARLRGNQRLHRELSSRSFGHSLPLEGEKLQELMGLIARGLVWYHWKTYLNDELHSVVVKTVTGPGAAYFKNVVFKFKARNRVEQTIGRDIFKYEGLQGIDAPELTIWRFEI
jgi:hypothetical protein